MTAPRALSESELLSIREARSMASDVNTPVPLAKILYDLSNVIDRLGADSGSGSVRDALIKISTTPDPDGWKASFTAKAVPHSHSREFILTRCYNKGELQLYPNEAAWMALQFLDALAPRIAALAPVSSAPAAEGGEWQPMDKAPPTGEIEAEDRRGNLFRVWRRDIAFIGFPIKGGYLCVPDLVRWRPVNLPGPARVEAAEGGIKPSGLPWALDLRKKTLGHGTSGMVIIDCEGRPVAEVHPDKFGFYANADAIVQAINAASPPSAAVRALEVTDDMVLKFISASDPNGLTAEKGSFLWETTENGLRAALASATPEKESRT